MEAALRLECYFDINVLRTAFKCEHPPIPTKHVNAARRELWGSNSERRWGPAKQTPQYLIHNEQI